MKSYTILIHPTTGVTYPLVHYIQTGHHIFLSSHIAASSLPGGLWGYPSAYGQVTLTREVGSSDM